MRAAPPCSLAPSDSFFCARRLAGPVPAAAWPESAPGFVALFFGNRAADILNSGKYDPSNIPDDADAFRNEFIQMTTDFTWSVLDFLELAFPSPTRN